MHAVHLSLRNEAISSPWVWGETFGQALINVPSGLNTNVLRITPMDFLPWLVFSPHAPKASSNVWSGSERSVKFRLYVSLNFTYREFTGEDLARPAFYQNVTYQAAARQIQFKSFTINILEASNEKITYSISDDGSNSWR